MAGFTSNGLCFSFAENDFQEIPVDFSLQKDVLYHVSKGFLTHPSSVKWCFRALPKRLGVLRCCKLMGFLPLTTTDFILSQKQSFTSFQ